MLTEDDIFFVNDRYGFIEISRICRIATSKKLSIYTVYFYIISLEP